MARRSNRLSKRAVSPPIYKAAYVDAELDNEWRKR